LYQVLDDENSLGQEGNKEMGEVGLDFFATKHEQSFDMDLAKNEMKANKILQKRAQDTVTESRA
jgi:hypothetical protein